MGGTDWGHVDLREARRSVRRALELGITVFDTADVYGLGRSEEELARALGADRHAVAVVTKFGIRWRVMNPCCRAATFRDASAAHMVRALEASLRRLRLEAIPLYLVHWPDPNTPLEETLNALEHAREQGKILEYGLSNFPPDEVTRASRSYALAAIETRYSLMHRLPGEGVLSAARAQGLTTLTYGPLAQGMLSGKYSAASDFGPTDRRHRLPHFSRGHWRTNLVLLRAIDRVARARQKSPAQVALRWVLDSGLADVVVVGAKTMAQVESNLGALGWTLAVEEKEFLEQAVPPALSDC